MTKDDEESAEFLCAKLGIALPGRYDLGGIIGQARIVDRVKHSDAPWFYGPYGFVLRDGRPLPFRPIKGQLGFFEVGGMGNVDATQSPRPVLQVHLEAALRVATTHIEGAEGRWKRRARSGMSDAELADALKEELGIAGGASGYPGCPSVWFTGTGLKIWVSWGITTGQGTPVLKGAATVRLARRMYRIPYPAKESQMLLFSGDVI